MVQLQTSDGEQATWTLRWQRLTGWTSTRADRAERSYLAFLRLAVLACASLALVGAALLLSWGAIKQLGSSSVDPARVTVTPDDIAPPKEDGAAPKVQAANGPLAIDKEVRARTLDVYRKAFKPYERSGKSASDDDVIAAVWTQERLQAFVDLPDPLLTDGLDKTIADSREHGMQALYMAEKAVETETFKHSLTAYRDAKEVRVCSDQYKTRSRSVSSWDPYSMSGPGWYNAPYGCPSTRTVQEPYVEKACQMRLPENLDTPVQAMSGAIARYAEIATSKAAQSRLAAERNSNQIVARKLSGRDDMRTALLLFVGFMGIMLLYLLIAIERHHRLIRKLVPGEVNEKT